MISTYIKVNPELLIKLAASKTRTCTFLGYLLPLGKASAMLGKS